MTSQHNADAYQGDHGGVEASEGGGCPQAQSQNEYAQNGLFVAAHGAHGCQFLAGNFRSLRSFLELGWEQLINQIRANN